MGLTSQSSLRASSRHVTRPKYGPRGQSVSARRVMTCGLCLRVPLQADTQWPETGNVLGEWPDDGSLKALRVEGSENSPPCCHGNPRRRGQGAL